MRALKDKSPFGLISVLKWIIFDSYYPASGLNLDACKQLYKNNL